MTPIITDMVSTSVAIVKGWLYIFLFIGIISFYIVHFIVVLSGSIFSSGYMPALRLPVPSGTSSVPRPMRGIHCRFGAYIQHPLRENPKGTLLYNVSLGIILHAGTFDDENAVLNVLASFNHFGFIIHSLLNHIPFTCQEAETIRGVVN